VRWAPASAKSLLLNLTRVPSRLSGEIYCNGVSDAFQRPVQDIAPFRCRPPRRRFWEEARLSLRSIFGQYRGVRVQSPTEEMQSRSSFRFVPPIGALFMECALRWFLRALENSVWFASTA
jgi:hypothetical protein